MVAAAEIRNALEVSVDTQSRAGGVDHLNLAEFPLAAFSKRRSLSEKTLEFSDEIFDEGAGRKVQRRLVVSASDRFGLPTPADSDVLLVLIHCTKMRSGFENRVVRFSRYELVDRLGWDHGGKSYRRIDESLQRWAGCTLYYNSAWWDCTVRRWRSKTFHVLESVELRGRGESGDDGLSSVCWNEVLFETFRESNLRSLDLDFYFRLKKPAARQAFRYLDKWFYDSRQVEFDLRVFACEHVGLSREHDSAQLKRALEPVLGELEDAGYLEKTTGKKRYIRRGHGEWSIQLRRADANADCTLEADDLVKELVSRGVWGNVARGLTVSVPVEVIRDYLELHDYLLARNDKRIAKNSAGFLAASISRRMPFPPDFLETREKSLVAKAVAVPSVVNLATIPAKREVDPFSPDERKFLAGLSEDERRALETKALRSANHFMRENYQRLKAENGPLFEPLREKLLLDEVRRSKVTKRAG